jgi:hypothetical protein
MAAIAASPVVIAIAFPCTVIPDTVNNQNVGVFPVKLINSISPVKRELFVPPSVKTPPGSSLAAVRSFPNRVSQNDISWVASWFPSDRASQNGFAWVLAIVWNASPIMPDTELSRSCELAWLTASIV